MILLLLLATFAHAADREYLSFSADSTRVAFRLPIPTPAECERSVQEMLFPTASIKAGLEQLAALNDGQSASVAPCLQEAFRWWDSEHYEKMALESSGTATTDEDGAPLPSARYQQLEKLHACVDIGYAPGDLPPGCLKAVSAEKWKKLEAEWQKESSILEAARVKWMDHRLKLETVFNYLPPNLKNEVPEAQRLSTKAVCHRNPDPVQFAKDQQSMTVCEGLWQDEPVSTKERTEWTKLLNQRNSARMDKSIQLTPLRLFLGQPGSKKLLDQSGLLELAAQLQCANEAEPGTYAFALYRGELSSLCEGRWLSASQTKELHAKFEEKAKPLLTAAEKWNAERMASLGQRQAAFDQSHADEIGKYAAQRLMALFHAHLGAGGKVSDAGKFCAEYAQRMKADAGFFRSVPPFFRQYGSLAYAQPADWDRAAKFGLTEADLAAIKAYTGAYYLRINPALLSPAPLSPEMEIFKNAFDQALKHIPAYHEGTVLRFVTLPPDILEKHQVGATVCYPSYTSTSRDPAWHWGGAHKMLIYPGEKARLLELVSNLKSEQEVLFDAGTCFKVLSREKGKENELDFVLAETDAGGKVIAKVPGGKP